MNLWTFFEEQYRPRKLRGAGAQRTAILFAIAVGHFKRFLGREPVVDDLTEDSILRFLDHHTAGRAAVTVNRSLEKLLALWRFACRRNLLREWPDIMPMPEPELVPEAWYLDQVQSILGACDRMIGTYDTVPRRDWWRSLYWFWWSCGERTEAALSVRRADVDLDRRSVKVLAEHRKGRKKEMFYVLRPECIEQWRMIWLPERELLFPFPFHFTTFYNHHKKLLRLAGLPKGRRNGPQRMRRTFASYLEAAGGNATEALGHSARWVTQRSYLDTRICGGSAPADLLPVLPVVPKIDAFKNAGREPPAA